MMFWTLTLLGFACVGLLIVKATRSDRALILFCLLTLVAVVGGAIIASHACYGPNFASCQESRD